MVNEMIQQGMDEMQIALRRMLNDDTIVLREESTTVMLIEKFNFTVEFLPSKDMIHMSDDAWRERKQNGVVMVPSDSDKGRDFMRKRNVAVMALWKLRDAAKLKEESVK